jgi:predicted nuclease of predicted toxin-antitoxin system
MTRFLLDQGLPRSSVAGLARGGFTAEHVGDLGMAKATDAEVLEAARVRRAVVVTLDADFHSLLAASHASTPSVIRIRMEGLRGEDLVGILRELVATTAEELEAGAAVSVTRNRVRIRLLPLP